MEIQKIEIKEIVSFFSDTLQIKTIEFINSNALAIYTASYKSGQLGRLFLKFIKENFRHKLNFNGNSTFLAIAIIRELENKKFDFIVRNKILTFEKIK